MSAYRLGLLLCDHVSTALGARFGDYPAMFEQAFAATGADIAWQVYDATAGELPRNTDECHGWLLSGSRHGAYEDLPWIAPLEHCLRAIVAAGRPLVGICFGHQVLAQALGGTVGLAPQGWGLGIHAYAVTRHDAFMQPALPSFRVPVCHQDQVTRLPPGARVLAASDHCPYFAVRYAPRAFGIQGHPEFSPAYLGALVESRRDNLPVEISRRAFETLTVAHDSDALKRWILHFLGALGVS
ncbi:MAG: type 1 glutamine amidotransferase [Gammaproteobacteria bacterium]